MSAVGLTDVYRYGTRFLGTLLVVAGVGGGLIAAGYVLIQNGSLGSLSGNAGYRAVLGIVVGALGGLLLLSGLLGLTHKLIADATMAGTLAARTAQREASDVAVAGPPASDQTATESTDDSAAPAAEPVAGSDEQPPEPAEPEPAVSQETEPADDPAAVEPATAEPEVSEPTADSESDADSSGEPGIRASAQQHPDPPDAAEPTAASDTAPAEVDDAPVTAADDDPLADADPATDDGPVAEAGSATDADPLGADDAPETASADDTSASATDEDAMEAAATNQEEQTPTQRPAENAAGSEPETADETSTSEASPSDFPADSETADPQSEPSEQSDRDLLAEDPVEEPEMSTEPQEWTPPDPAEFDTQSEEPAADDWEADESAPADDWSSGVEADTESTGVDSLDADGPDQHDAVTEDTRLLDESGGADTSSGPRTTDDLFGGGTGDEQSDSGADESAQGEAESQDADATDDEDSTLADEGITGFDVSSDDDPLSDPLDDE